MAFPWPLLAMAAIQAGASFMQQRETMKAARRAQKRSAAESIENQKRLVEQAQKERRQAQGAFGTVLGGPSQTPSQQVSQSGTVLTQADTQKRSLLGG
jgi:Flp pilus assembly protein TadB